jgi:stage II sporulation protein D
MIDDAGAPLAQIKKLQEKYKRDLVAESEYEEILECFQKKLAVAREYQKRSEEEKLTNYTQKEFERAQKLSDYGDYKGAGRIYDNLLQKSYAAKQLEYARSLYAKGDYDQALVIYQKLLESYPDSEWVDDAYFGLGMLYYDLGKYDEAVDTFNKIRDGRFKSNFSRQAEDMVQKSLLATYELPNAIRVLILPEASKVKIEARQGFKIIDLTNGATILFVSLEKSLSFRKTQEGIKIKGKKVNSFVTVPVKIIPLKEEDFLKINGIEYRGYVVLRRNRAGALQVINEVNVDDYLYGVLPHEISGGWPPASLEAQAVASRTLALYRQKRNRAANYDLDITVFSQVYRGREDEDERTNRAVNETRGKVLISNNRIINSIFHATCGGHTEDAANVWIGAGQPYLKGISCNYCQEAPHYEWERRIKEKELREILKEKGLDLNKIKEIQITKESPTGRAIEIDLRQRRTTQPLAANNFRLFLGPELLRSTFFTISKEKKEFIFTGHGWGHGVGMCQWGAKGMAEKGKSFQEILEYYYPGAKIEKGY